MALTRKFLSALEIEAEKIDEIIGAHSDTVNGLKAEITDLKDKIEKGNKTAEDLKVAQKELKDLQEKVDAEAKEREGKDYDSLLKEFNDYKAEQERKAVRGQKETAFKAILKDAGIPERHFAKIVKYSDVDGLELTEKGEIKTAKELMKSIKEEWSDHIEKVEKQGADENKPPAGAGGGGMTKDEILAIKDTTERQAKIAENPELFGIS